MCIYEVLVPFKEICLEISDKALAQLRIAASNRLQTILSIVILEQCKMFDKIMHAITSQGDGRCISLMHSEKKEKLCLFRLFWQPYVHEIIKHVKSHQLKLRQLF